MPRSGAPHRILHALRLHFRECVIPEGNVRNTVYFNISM